MAERVSPQNDFVRTRGLSVREVRYRAYTPKTEADAEGFAAAVCCKGLKGNPRVERRDDLPVVVVRWALSGLGDAPVMRGKIVDGPDTYRIDTVTGSGPWNCDTILV